MSLNCSRRRHNRVRVAASLRKPTRLGTDHAQLPAETSLARTRPQNPSAQALAEDPPHSAENSEPGPMAGDASFPVSRTSRKLDHKQACYCSVVGGSNNLQTWILHPVFNSFATASRATSNIRRAHALISSASSRDGQIRTTSQLKPIALPTIATAVTRSPPRRPMAELSPFGRACYRCCAVFSNSRRF